MMFFLYFVPTQIYYKPIYVVKILQIATNLTL